MVMGGFVRELLIRVRMTQEGVKETTKLVTQNLNGMRQQMQAGSQIAGSSLRAFRTMNNAVTMSTKQFGNYAKSIPMTEWKELGFNLKDGGKEVQDATGKWMGFGDAQKQLSERISTGGAKTVNTMRQATHGMRGFKMEMLGVMFFGMGIQKFFAGFTKGAYEAYAITERFTQTFQEMVMIAIEPFTDNIHDMLDALEDLPEEQKVVIGLTIVGGELLGGILFNIGMMSLGIGSLIQAFGGLAIFK